MLGVLLNGALIDHRGVLVSILKILAGLGVSSITRISSHLVHVKALVRPPVMARVVIS